jgi:hypothetical protein
MLSSCSTSSACSSTALYEEKTESMGLLPSVDVSRASAQSKTLGDPGLKQLGADDVNKWVMYWKRVGFLSME